MTYWSSLVIILIAGQTLKGVIDELLALQDCCRTVFIKGNHEEMLENAHLGKDDYGFWLKYGGRQTLKSYTVSDWFDFKAISSLMPYEHKTFFKSLVPYYETDSHIFVHANYNPQLDLADHDGQTLRWEHMDYLRLPHKSGKVVVVGHSVRSEVMNLGHVIFVDTGASFSDGKLSAIDLASGVVYSEVCVYE